MGVEEDAVQGFDAVLDVGANDVRGCVLIDEDEGLAGRHRQPRPDVEVSVEDGVHGARVLAAYVISQQRGCLKSRVGRGLRTEW